MLESNDVGQVSPVGHSAEEEVFRIEGELAADFILERKHKCRVVSRHLRLGRISHVPARLVFAFLSPAYRHAYGKTVGLGGGQHLRTIALGLSAVTVQKHKARLARQQGLRHIEIVLALQSAEFETMVRCLRPQVLSRLLCGTGHLHNQSGNRSHRNHISLGAGLVGYLSGRKYGAEHLAVGTGRNHDLSCRRSRVECYQICLLPVGTLVNHRIRLSLGHNGLPAAAAPEGRSALAKGNKAPCPIEKRRRVGILALHGYHSLGGRMLCALGLPLPVQRPGSGRSPFRAYREIQIFLGAGAEASVLR